ncbi:DNA cytosine methyltransferase [Halobacterium noricense]|uniref:DNA cytosine methyltransferase n=1 Tax=Halobacterium noricense TaxID=223182 RepID=UPI001E492DE9|nr:DNA cytosine methyltransferase [Halobacterium noricense]UHH25530.1 DNA cytosine methyltransferase [Halobacterium noricense]
MAVLDLFCGAGGLSAGFDQAGYDVVGGVDHEDAFAETFEHNHDAQFVEADLSKVTGEAILAELGYDPGDLDGVIGGPPCQGFSLAGAKTNPADERNFLVTNFVKSVYEIDPDWFVMENVPRITTMEDGQVLEYLLDQFAEIGYDTEWTVLNAADYGVPQSRRRAFFVGHKTGEAFEFPEAAFRESRDQQTLFADRRPPRTVQNAFGDLPSLAPGEEKTTYTADPEGEYQTEMRADGTELTNHRAPNHGETVTGRIEKTAPGEKIPYDSWSQKRRLEFGEPAPTLLAGPRPTYHFAHPTDDRGLSVRERARLQSFPDDYLFVGPIAKQRQMTGNAVPPLLGRAVAEAIAEQTVPA